jgi:hypothetical protein
MKRFLILLALGLSLVIPQISKSQASVHINGVPRTSGYPSIKVDFTAKKSNGDQLKITDFSGSDVWVTDNGVKKFGTVECPDPGVSKFSTILVIDISGSMMDKVEGAKTKMDLAKLAAKEWVKNLPNGRFECAIMLFHSDVYLISDFTESKAQLNHALDTNLLQPIAQGTDFNSAMLYDQRYPAQPGALRVAERAKYAPYIIFLTDGGHEILSRPNVMRQEIVEKTMALGAKIFTVTMTPPDLLVPSQVDDIYAISTKVYWDRRSTASIIATYQEILEEVKYTAPPPPCIFTFEGDCNSSDKLLLYVDNPYVNGYDSTSFTVPSNLLPYLEYSAEFKIPFLNVPKGTPQTRNFSITPRQNFVRFTGPPIIDNPNFKILNPDPASWSNLTVNMDVPLTITVEYTEPPGDSICRQAQIEFVGTACKDKIGTVSAGWLITKPIDFGSRKINTEHTMNYTTVFCNRSCFDINIDDMYIGGGAANKFSLKSAKYTGGLVSGQCIDLTFAFTPDKAELFESQFNVVVGGKVYSSPIKGTGTGNAELEAVNSLKFNPNASCTNPNVENTITVKNVGALPLNITNISIDDGGNQAGIFVHNDPLPPPIDPDQTANIKVQFKPTSAKTYSGYSLIIESNAASNPKYNIALTATMDSVGFTTDKPTIDLGVLCPSETGTQTITLDPQGSDVPFDITATTGGSLTAADISGGTASWNFTPGNSQQVSISVSGKSEGIFNGNIQFKDSKCNRTIDIPVKWEIAQPDIDDITVNFTANVNQTNLQNVTITNNSKRDYNITDTIIKSTEFFVEKGSLILPALVAKNGGTLTFNTIYAPTKSGSETAFLVLSGSPCNYSDSVRLVGAATAARADLVIKQHRGIIGEVVTIPIDIENGQNIPGSDTKAITTEVIYDNTLLDPQDFLNQFKGTATIIGGNKLKISGIPVLEINGNQSAVENLKFRVLGGSPNSSCDLILNNSISDAPGVASLTQVNGKFTLDLVTADIKVGNITAFPGQKIGIPITITNFKNYKPAVNKTLNIDLKFNKTVLECNDGSITCNVVTNDRIARIPVPLAGVSGTDLPVISKQFRTMLGLAETTPLEIVGVSFETGELDANITNGTLTLEICKSGGDRLFDANTPAAMIYSPEPNPVNSATVIKYQTPEQGMTKVFISDLIGNHVLDLVNTFVDPGVYSVIFDGSVLSNGVYIITIKTETQLVSKIFSVVN